MNENPVIYDVENIKKTELKFKNNKLEEVNENTVFELIRNIVDPEHPQTLEQLGVVSLEYIKVFYDTEESEFLNKGLNFKTVYVEYKPTIPHCSMATVIGLALKIQLMKYININYHIVVKIVKDSHIQENEINKQLNDKDRIYAASENEGVMGFLLPLLVDFDTS
ncbi:hypothetical protein GVAV_000632 [Gurleya vavrai]